MASDCIRCKNTATVVVGRVYEDDKTIMRESKCPRCRLTWIEEYDFQRIQKFSFSKEEIERSKYLVFNLIDLFFSKSVIFDMEEIAKRKFNILNEQSQQIGEYEKIILEE